MLVKGIRTHVEGLDEREGNPARQLNRRAQWSQDARGVLKGLRHKREPIVYSAVLAVLLAMVVFLADGQYALAGSRPSG